MQNSRTQSSTDNNPSKPKTPKAECVIDGIRYLNDLDGSDMKEIYTHVRDIKIRDDDTIMMGFPKSGNHWVFEILNMILYQDTRFTETLMSDCFMEFVGMDTHAKMHQIKSPRVLCTHLRSHRLPKEVIEKRVKIVYIIRNPKDVAVSLYNMCREFKPDGYKYGATFNEYFDEVIRGAFYWGHWFDHVLSFEEFMKNNPNHPVFVVAYEKLKQAPTEAIKELCAFLNKPDAIAEGIAKETEMSNMSKTLMSGKEGQFQKDVFKSADAIFRKGISRGWKSWLTVSQSEAMDELFQEKMSTSKLAPLVKQYI